MVSCLFFFSFHRCFVYMVMILLHSTRSIRWFAKLNFATSIVFAVLAYLKMAAWR